MIKVDYVSSNITDVQEILKLDNSYNCDMYSDKQILDFFNINYYRVIVAKESDKIIGYICFSIIFEECNLIKIVVDKDYRKMGIGKKKENEMMNTCKENNVSKIYLEVREDNISAISFYEKLGFEFENLRPNYYGDINAKIYERKIWIN